MLVMVMVMVMARVDLEVSSPSRKLLDRDEGDRVEVLGLERVKDVCGEHGSPKREMPCAEARQGCVDRDRVPQLKIVYMNA